MKEYMKVITAIIFALFLAACSEKDVTTAVAKTSSRNIEGTYIAQDNTAYTFTNGVIKMEAHGVLPARTTTYRIINDRIEYTFDNASYFKIENDKKLVWHDMITYIKK